MLHPIRVAHVPPPTARLDEPADVLLACHARLRELCGVALALTQYDASDSEEVTSAAARLAHYFSETLRSHEADEDDTVAARLVAHDPRLATTIALVLTQHAMLRDVIREVLPLWTSIAQRADRLGDFRHRLVGSTRRLTSMLAVHLELEETLLFSRLGELPEDQRRAMCAEMRKRRDLP